MRTEPRGRRRLRPRVAIGASARQAAALVALSALLGACGDDPTRARQQSRSWQATARMAAEAWSAGHVPTPYARRTLETAARELTRGQASLPPEDAAAASRAAAVVRALAEAIDREDRGTVDTTLQGLGGPVGAPRRR